MPADFTPDHHLLSAQLNNIRKDMRAAYLADEASVLTSMISRLAMAPTERASIAAAAAQLVRQVRSSSTPTMMEKFLGEYGLSSKEGIALMCMAEALLRVPDKATIDTLIEDKIQSGDWSSHVGHSDSHLINSSTWALLMTGKLLAPVDSASVGATLRTMVKRLGEPVVRTAVAQAMKELGAQFVLGRNIAEACKRAAKQEAKGYSYSYDMLGEAAHTAADAQRYFTAYSDAITALQTACQSTDMRANPGISVKLSALHPRYEYAQRETLLEQLVPSVLALAKQAKAANIGFNIDAEEADRLDLSLDIIEQVLGHPCLAGWHGFGVVVQAFGKRASHVLDWLYTLSQQLDRRIMVRLVKGAYWDAEIKRAQVLGLPGFPVYTRKVCTDVAYLACARQLLTMNDRIYAQFATHNAHSVAAITHMAKGKQFEFQRLHGMGESLYQQVMQSGDVRCRIYAPVGAHQDLLAYLVRRLLENGANSSFVHQLVNPDIAPETIAKDPLSILEQRQQQGLPIASEVIAPAQHLFGRQRDNAKGWDITDPLVVADLCQGQVDWQPYQWQAQPILHTHSSLVNQRQVINPALPGDLVGDVYDMAPQQVSIAIADARLGYQAWAAMPIAERHACFVRLARLYEQHAPEFFTLLCREAGKTWLDAIGEVREAVDFIRYYGNDMLANPYAEGRGIMTCISPWNFPLAIFTGQVAAALAAGNAVLAKPAEQTSLVAYRAVQLMHLAGIPLASVQYLPGGGADIGASLVAHEGISGVCFTGSTATAQRINQSMADYLPVDAPLIAETGGLNAMIVDSTALPEQVVRDVLAAAFQSAGQRCSALRMLYVQADVADKIFTMLFGAMDALKVGDPALLSTDVGPVIDAQAKAKIDAHIAQHEQAGRVLKRLAVPAEGLFVAPTVIKLDGIAELQEEIFGPVLHVATYAAKDLPKLVADINQQGYGLTFGVHTRLDVRVEQLVSQVHAGNIYVNRNQIGAVVGSQPFGGEGLSGTGPKAGGPQYVQRLRRPQAITKAALKGLPVGAEVIQTAVQRLNLLDIASWQASQQRPMDVARVFGPGTDSHMDLCRDKMLLPGPTGELNQLTIRPRGTILCLGPSREAALLQARMALLQGNRVLLVAQSISLPEHGLPMYYLSGYMAADIVTGLQGIDAVACNGEAHYLRQLRVALAKRTGPLVPLILETADAQRFTHERHLCIDTTAAGGNASLIAAGD
ncbi:MAG: bifunctional proline dehydrogenase/L-glutamate gamma-semialdehyde dehydrogenase PutA [Gammaproteobacteria bacterium]|nr:bifunctional proline dehydrogenase/L-glutamate gamma-semialdehyde dehydrogenase PutA [Gammaproteobacteria bacterium]